MKRFSLFALVLLLPLMSQAQDIELELYVDGLNFPVDLANAGDGRFFVVERLGRIIVIDENGNKLSTPFLDLGSQINSSPNERGLLGLAFHPDYSNNGFFYVNYTRSDGDTRVSRFSVDANDPNVADPNSEEIIIEIEQPEWNHNGGDLNFGADGYLYIGMGDGGFGGDPDNYGQNRQSLLGKMLRIDISTTPYTIPADNPFVNDDETLDEIWALGLRNPWRFSFDRETNDMWIGDVGQQIWEEIDFQPADSPGGENYGWRCYEGDNPFNTSGCGPATDYVMPAHDYSHSGLHCSVTGGYVYRGCDQYSLQGMYIYGDYCSGRIWGITPDGSGGWTNEEVANYGGPGFSISSFGEDENGELYLVNMGGFTPNQGEIYRVVEADASTFVIATNNMNDVLIAPTGFTTYQWNLNGNPIASETGTTIVPDATGDYTVTMTTDQGCSYTTEVFSFIVSQDELDVLETIQLNPNPFTERIDITISVNAPSQLQLQLLDVQGQVLRSEKHQVNGEMSLSWGMESLPVGVYFLNLSNEDGSVVRRIVKQ